MFPRPPWCEKVCKFGVFFGRFLTCFSSQARTSPPVFSKPKKTLFFDNFTFCVIYKIRKFVLAGQKKSLFSMFLVKAGKSKTWEKPIDSGFGGGPETEFYKNSCPGAKKQVGGQKNTKKTGFSSINSFTNRVCAKLQNCKKTCFFR